MLNTAQWAGNARIVIMIASTVAVTLGWTTQEKAAEISANPAVLAIVAGILGIVIPWIYAIKSRTAKGIGRALAALPEAEQAKAASALPPTELIKATAALPQVAEIQVPVRIADAIPSDKVVPADRR